MHGAKSAADERALTMRLLCSRITYARSCFVRSLSARFIHATDPGTLHMQRSGSSGKFFSHVRHLKSEHPSPLRTAHHRFCCCYRWPRPHRNLSNDSWIALHLTACCAIRATQRAQDVALVRVRRGELSSCAASLLLMARMIIRNNDLSLMESPRMFILLLYVCSARADARANGQGEVQV
jgi:hypothetical protein